MPRTRGSSRDDQGLRHTELKDIDSFAVPQVAWAQEIAGPAHFVKKYGSASTEEWMQALISATGDALGELPGYPDGETMRRIHGGLSVEHAMREARRKGVSDDLG